MRLERDHLSPRGHKGARGTHSPQSPEEGLSHPSRQTGPQAPCRGPNTAHCSVSEPDALC